MRRVATRNFSRSLPGASRGPDNPVGRSRTCPCAYPAEGLGPSPRPTVGMTGFEPASSCSQSKRSTKLNYIPGWCQRPCRDHALVTCTILPPGFRGLVLWPRRHCVFSDPGSNGSLPCERRQCRPAFYLKPCTERNAAGPDPRPWYSGRRPAPGSVSLCIQHQASYAGCGPALQQAGCRPASSEKPDLNRRPLAPEASALPNCATLRYSGLDAAQAVPPPSSGAPRRALANEKAPELQLQPLNLLTCGQRPASCCSRVAPGPLAVLQAYSPGIGAVSCSRPGAWIRAGSRRLPCASRSIAPAPDAVPWLTTWKWPKSNRLDNACEARPLP